MRIRGVLGPALLALLALPVRAGAQAVVLLDGTNNELSPERAALRVSQLVTNGDTLSASGFAAQSPGTSDVRIEVRDPNARGRSVAVTLESLDAVSGKLRGKLELSATRAAGSGPFRSDFIRIVGDDTDRQARGVEGRALRVALRDRVLVRYAGLSLEYRVARPGSDASAEAARQVRLHVHIMRRAPGEPAVVGESDLDALRLIRDQLRVVNEIWLQCQLTFGDPAQVAVELLDPPGPTLIAVADQDGLPARGGGEIQLRIDGQEIGPIPTRAGATPAQTARDIARALSARGFIANVSENLKTRFGAGPSADVLVERRDGSFVTITPLPGTPLSSDVRQKIAIGSVDLRDGLREFDNSTAQVGTLEERTLIKALADDDPSTIDLFVVNRFEYATRQGEAFIASGQGPISNVVVIDRNGLRQAPLAWTLAHELGHVLLDDPMHPDNVGPDRPWLLMDADSGRGTVNGPKRLRAEECARVRRVAQTAKVPLLLPYPDLEPAPAAVSNARKSSAAPQYNAKPTAPARPARPAAPARRR